MIVSPGEKQALLTLWVHEGLLLGSGDWNLHLQSVKLVPGNTFLLCRLPPPARSQAFPPAAEVLWLVFQDYVLEHDHLWSLPCALQVQ